jgi:hypothetical protein
LLVSDIATNADTTLLGAWLRVSCTDRFRRKGANKLQQDIWAAFRKRRQILSFYKVTRPCATLDFWELVDRSVYLLGQCVNYASIKEEDNGRSDMQRRLDDSAKMWEKLEEFISCFKKHDRRLPASRQADSPFTPIWINPPAASE